MIAIRLLTMFVIVIAFIIALGLWQTRDGNLRKLLIVYFLIEILIWNIVLFYAIKLDFPPLMKSVLICILIPKSLSKGAFYLYISKKRKGDNLTNNH